MDAVDACAHLVRGRMDWNPGTGTGVADAQALLIRECGLSVSASFDMFEITPRIANHFVCLKQNKRVGNHRGFLFETVLRIFVLCFACFCCPNPHAMFLCVSSIFFPRSLHFFNFLFTSFSFFFFIFFFVFAVIIFIFKFIHSLNQFRDTALNFFLYFSATRLFFGRFPRTGSISKARGAWSRQIVREQCAKGLFTGRWVQVSPPVNWTFSLRCC